MLTISASRDAGAGSTARAAGNGAKQATTSQTQNGITDRSICGVVFWLGEAAPALSVEPTRVDWIDFFIDCCLRLL
jgi:hypothetical protein